MKTFQYELNSGLYIEYDLDVYSDELERLCDVRLGTSDMVMSVFEDYIPKTKVSKRVFIDKDPRATASVYNIKGDYVRMSLAGSMDSPIFLATLIHELSHARQALESFWRGMLFDYEAVRNSDYILTPSKLEIIGKFLPEVRSVFDGNMKMYEYFNEYSSINSELNTLSYPFEPSASLWSRLTGDYKKQLADYELRKSEVICRRTELEKKRRSLHPSYNKGMCDRLPSLLVEFDANQRTFEYLKDLRTRGFIFPDRCLAADSGEYVGLEKKLEFALGYWVVGDFEYPTDFAGVARLCN